ncbi:MAG TPA: alcohol dehydrogenase catalytic domain-containing protein [Candidatus Dormibacteraeota bacterium]|nr:alcohol dehydrogenase catalytic domain-containing protein [Candidatus Dormibacteraeota bacterium]
MRAMLLEGEWAPREGFTPTSARQVAPNGNLAWRHPRFSIVDVAEPKIQADEVLIRVLACGICGSDVHMYERDADGYMVYPGLVAAPVVTGHEFSGVVAAVGSAVTDLRPGDAVCAEEIAWCGSCYPCRAGLFNHCERLEELGFTFNGAHAELVATKAKYCWPIDGIIDRFGRDQGFLCGALVEPTSVAYLGMFVQAQWRPGATLGVVGAGPIGLAAVALGRAAGAGRVVVFEPARVRRELALAMGADEAYDATELGGEGMVAMAREETRGRGFDMWVEASAAPGVLDPITRALAPCGQVVLIGLGPHRANLLPANLVRSGAGLRGSLGHAGFGAFGNVIRLMAAGALNMGQIVTTQVELDDAVACLERLRDREMGKCVVVFPR